MDATATQIIAWLRDVYGIDLGPSAHDVIACRTRLEEDALVDCPDCGGPHPTPCIYKPEAAAWARHGMPITPRQLRQIHDQRKDHA